MECEEFGGNAYFGVDILVVVGSKGLLRADGCVFGFIPRGASVGLVVFWRGYYHFVTIERNCTPCKTEYQCKAVSCNKRKRAQFVSI